MPPVFIADSVQPFNIPIDKLLIQYPGKRLAVGVAIFSTTFSQSRSHSLPQKKLLLLQRAETEDVYPLVFELPGGKSEPDDPTLLSTVIRETKEETGLTVTEIWDTFPGFEFETPKGKAIQFNFLIGVEGGAEMHVQLNPEEHCSFVWVDKMVDLSHYAMTKSMRKAVSDALIAIEKASSE